MFSEGATMKEQYIFTIDNGTQSVRAIIFDTQGNMIAKGKQELEPYFSTQPGWAEQDPEYYWSSLGKACEKLWACTDIDRSKIIAATVTTQRGTVVNVDQKGQAIRPAIIWLDQRRAKVTGDVPGL